MNTPQKKSINLFIDPELKRSLQERIDKNNKNKNLNTLGIYFGIQINESGLPIAILNKTVFDATNKLPTDKEGKVLPYFLLFPYRPLQELFFKCDNCSIPGQSRGYIMQVPGSSAYTYCSICTEGV